jgi:hypothetical protein
MDSLCPLVEGSAETACDRLTVGSILRTFLPVLPPLLKLGNHKLQVLWHLAACGTPALGANLFACPHCPHRHWAPRSCGDRHCPRCLAAKSWQWLEKQTRSLLALLSSGLGTGKADSSASRVLYLSGLPRKTGIGDPNGIRTRVTAVKGR